MYGGGEVCMVVLRSVWWLSYSGNYVIAMIIWWLNDDSRGTLSSIPQAPT